MSKTVSNHLIKVTPAMTATNEQKIFNTGDILYGKVNNPTEFVMYTGGETESAVVYVDNNIRKITAAVRGAIVEDVKVDNVSVVKNKIAYIELEPIRNLITVEKERAIDRENEIDDARVHSVKFSNTQGTEKLKITLKDKNNVLIATDDIDLGEIVSGIIKVELKTDENGFYLLFTKGNGTEIKCYLNSLVSDYESKILAEQNRATAQENVLTNAIQTESTRASQAEETLGNAIAEVGDTVPLISTGEKEYKFYIRLQNGKPQLVYEEI